MKRLRLSKGLTQEELAERTDLSRSFISQLESNKTSPSIDTLETILRALGTDLKHFFSDFEEKKVVFRKEERVPMYDLPDGVKMCYLMVGVEDKSIDPMLVELDPGAQTEEEDYHEGSEFGYVIDGRIELYLDENKYKLKKGDAFYYTADKKHYIKNPDRKKKAVVLWIEIED
ncbi:MAG: helix-turn-helix transcriptional regulator [Thermotogaceae bacterium]|nr:helix-turn-helix transcriptional regulator [Thermotogaceae bacterium]